MEWIGQDPQTGEHIYDTGTETIRTATPPDQMEATQPGWQSQPQRFPIRAFPRPHPTPEETPPVEKLSAEQSHLLKLQQDFGEEPLGLPTSINPTAEMLSYRPSTDLAQTPTGEGAPTDRPPAPEGPPPTVTPSARMASIRAKLAEIDELRKKTVTGQRGSLDALTTDYQTELKRIKDESEITDARGRVDRANNALGTITNKLASFEINPQRAFPNAFSKVAAVISVAMGAYAQGLSGGKLPNTALQIINTAIDRDIDAQKMEYQKLKGLVDEKRNVYAAAMRMLGDERQADALLRTAAHQAFGTRFKTLSQQMGIENSKISQAYQEAGLLQRENAERAKLDVLAAKAVQKPVKVGKQIGEALELFTVGKNSMQKMWKLSKQFTYAGAKFDPINPWESPSYKFDQLSKLSMLDMLRAMSGLTVTEQEREAYKELYPDSNDVTQEVREGKMLRLMTLASNKGAGWFRTLPAAEKAHIAESAPELAGIWADTNEGSRARKIYSLVSGGEALNPDVWDTAQQYKVQGVGDPTRGR